MKKAAIAANKVDCFITYGDKLYDTAAGVLIAQEAGCQVSNWHGSPWSIRTPDLIVAPRNIHSKLVKLLKTIFPNTHSRA